MKEITVPARTDELDRVLDFISEQLEEYGCPMKYLMQIQVAAEEIYVNIAHYAYHPDEGLATIRCTVGGEPLEVSITFLDNGRPYNPLAQKDPDVTLSAEERRIGGLGVYMAKNLMDGISYRSENGCNILTINKLLAE